jgi:hypothetical protein
LPDFGLKTEAALAKAMVQSQRRVICNEEVTNMMIMLATAVVAVLGGTTI